jgi:hypothetical protein
MEHSKRSGFDLAISFGQPPRSGLPTWGLDKVLTTPYCKNLTSYETKHKTSNLAKFFEHPATGDPPAWGLGDMLTVKI